MKRLFVFLCTFSEVKMCRSKVLAVFDMHLICATFLKVDFGTDNQLCVKDPLKHLTWKVLTKL